MPNRRALRLRSRPSAFTLVELLVVIAIIIALLAILLPSMNQAIAISQSAVCSSQQRQIAQASLNSAADHFGELPAQDAGNILWLLPETRDEFNRHLSGSGAVFSCPSLDRADWGLSSGTIGAAAVGQDAQWMWDNLASWAGGRHLIGYFYLGNPTAGSNPDNLWADQIGQLGPQDDYVRRVNGEHNPGAALVADAMLRPAGGNLDNAVLRHPGGTGEGWANHARFDGSVAMNTKVMMLPRHGTNNALNSPAFW